MMVVGAEIFVFRLGGGAGRRGGHIVYWRYWVICVLGWAREQVICWFWQDMRAAML